MKKRYVNIQKAARLAGKDGRPIIINWQAMLSIPCGYDYDGDFIHHRLIWLKIEEIFVSN